MYTKVILTSLLEDTKADMWCFLAHGRDGSIYQYNTFSPISKIDKLTMFTRLQGLVKDGFINTNYWRLV